MIRYRFSFFFSSRRRHTRLVSDWSSDVCSSDLRRPAKKSKKPVFLATGFLLFFAGLLGAFVDLAFTAFLAGFLTAFFALAFGPFLAGVFLAFRSEERRVGIECSLIGEPFSY